MLVFAVESSCDETSVCLMNSDKTILSHIIYSQKIHSMHGGVVPELASRAHLEILQKITNESLFEAKVNPSEIDVFTSTCGPGLIGSLLVGSIFTKAMSIGVEKPFYPINHLEGHLYSTSYNNNINYPCLVLLLTGGHTQIYFMENEKKISLIGETVDDAVGEAFDKVAKLLGLGYPGGSEIEKKAINGDEDFFELPMPLIQKNNLNFSFSGLKTSVNLITKKNTINDIFINNMSASFQKTVSKILCKKIEIAIKNLESKNKKPLSLSVVGGVANNLYIKSKFERLLNEKNIIINYPEKEMLSDNAAMIAWACIKKFDKKNINLNFKVDPRLEVVETK